MPEHSDEIAVLNGLRVVDWTGGPEASRASSLLADYGADVVWVESSSSPAALADPVPRAVFARNKRSVRLDSAAEVAQEQLLALLSRADVFIVDQAELLTGKSDLGFARLHAAFPSLVCCGLSGFGPDAPGTESLPAYEALVHAYVGTMGEQVGYREAPIYEGLPFAGLGRAYLAQIAVLAALVRRRQDGLGRLVETSTLDGALSFLSMLWGHADVDDERAPRMAGGQRLLSRTFLCADEEYLGIHTGASGAFDRLIAVLGLSHLFAPTSNGRDVAVELSDEQRRILDEDVPALFLRRDRSTWLKEILAADVCAIPVLRPTEVFDEAQTRHNSMVVAVEDAVLGRVEQVAPPIRFGSGGGVPSVPSAAPMAGSESVDRLLEAWATRDRGAPAPEATPTPLLDGLKVLDLGIWYASGYSSRMLADLGADVIKVEPVVGDQMRGMRPPFQSAHSRKRSFAADLKHPDLARAVSGLLSWADVIHHNMRPGAAERLGLGYEQARAVNPDVVYLHAPGWGTSGPEMNRQSFAPLVSGYVGASYEVAGAFNPPTYPVGNEDPGAGMAGAVGILMALLRGRGTYLELPQLNAAMQQVAHIVRAPDGSTPGAGRLDLFQQRVSPLDGLYRTADTWICLAVLTVDELSALDEALGLGLLADERFATPEARGAHADELAGLLEKTFVTATTREWLERLGHAGVPALEPVSTHHNRAFHLEPAHRASGRVSAVAHAEGGQIRQIDSLIRVQDAPTVSYRLAPELGAHTGAVLAELGYAPEEITSLTSRGVIANP